MNRKLATAAALAATLGALGAATGQAATPKPGTYVWQDKAGGEIVSSVNLQVDDGSSKITYLFAQSVACGAPLSPDKAIKVKSSGKFKYDGKGSNPIGDSGEIEVKGKFVKPKRAEGSVQLGGCDEKMRFEVKYAGQKG